MSTEITKSVTEITSEKHGLIKVHGIFYWRDYIYEIIDIMTDEDGTVKYRVRDADGDEHDVYKSSVEDYYSYYEGNFDDLIDKAERLKAGTYSIDEYKDIEHDGSTQLMQIDKGTYEVLLSDVERKRHEIEIIKTHFLNLMNSAKWEMQNMISEFQGKIKKLREIIWTIELYLGIEEDIVRIQQGTPASDDEPIHMLQARLYMDEEVGDPTNGGLDFRSLEDFDKWLLTDSDYFGYPNYMLIVPYPKCIRIMRVRREKKQYSDNPFVNFNMNQPNMETYIIIRNGDNIYTISTSMEFGTKLFPDQDELVNMYAEMERDINDPNVISRSYDPEKRHMDEIDEFMHLYKRNMVVMQGLIDRTTIFGNLAGKVSFLTEKSSQEGKIVFFYENQGNTVTDGTEDAFSWYMNAKSNPQVGDRILYIPDGEGWRKDEKEYRLFKIYSWRGNYPTSPKTGIYTLKYDDDAETFYFMYLPDDDVYDRGSWDSHKRKKRSSWRLDDDETLNFDLISHRNIQWLNDMLHDRRARKHYNTYMRSLLTLKTYKEAELGKELPFCLLVQGTFPDMEIDEIRDYVFWWKTKNKWKRSLDVDDSKALRMIIKQIKTDIKNGTHII